MRLRINRWADFFFFRMWAFPIALLAISGALWFIGAGGKVDDQGRPFIMTGDPGFWKTPTIIWMTVWVIAGIYLYINDQYNRHQRRWAPRVRTQNRLRLIERMPSEFITARHIQQEQNVEIRNALIRRVGFDKFMQMVGAVAGAKDDFGQLYTYTQGNRTFAAVKVANSTPEPDGTFKDYWLRIPHDGARQPDRFCLMCGIDITGRIRSPKEAIAWTFHLCEPHYNPVVMS